MRFLHEDGEFGELLRIVAASRPERANAAVVEKDYWVTHTLWALQRQGFELWFKGGTSLSKGFGLLQRFSEDLDLALEAGTVPGLDRVTSWRATGKAATEKRRAYFAALEQAISVPDCELVLPGTSGRAVVDRVIPVRYPARFADTLPRGMRAHVQLELGRARVEPALERDLDSWVHAFVRSRGRQGEFEDNRPKALRCVHPLVTLLEKLEAISKKFERAEAEPTAYVRHYEDSARIIENQGSSAPLEGTCAELLADMLRCRDLRRAPTSTDPAFRPDSSSRWRELRRAHEQIAPLYWGERLPLAQACERIRGWLSEMETR